ncbi:CHAT domain-containing protein [Moorena sp. SIO3H5]|uniref:CHAT domain-containing protein n=1 Tax=Moorena sp. SIO3H5 TaxID=2607834 RepID=UPI0013BE0E00|nr:CHAT domain-containing protein [Moorena sp. SIO3H5]NEO71930.1 CHAT domain-containing protein [Moorena sp. SIO3H5]
MKLKQVLWLGLLTICLTPGELPVVARFLSLPALAQEQNTVSPEQEGTVAPTDPIVEVDSKKAEADKLVQQGISHFRRSEFPEALQSWQQALVIYKQIGDRKGEAASLGNLGSAYGNLANHKKAIDYYLPSLAIQREVGDRLGEAKSLGNLGSAYYHLGDYFKAIDYYQQSIAIAREIGDPFAIATSLGNLGLAYGTLGEYKKAIDYHQQSIAIAREIGDREAETNSLNSLGNAYDNLGNYKKAIDYHRQSIDIFREIRDREAEANSLNSLGDAYDNLGDYKKAIDYHRQSIDIFREIRDREAEANSLNSLGNAYYHLGEYFKAIDYHQKSLEIYREIEHRQGEASALNNLGIAYDTLGDYKKAIDYYQQSLAIARDIRHRQGEANSLNNLGIAYDTLGDYKKAIDYYQQSLAIKREIGDRNGEASSLGNLGSAYDNLGEYKTAIDYHQKSLEIYREIRDLKGEALSLGNLGNAYKNLVNYEKFHLGDYKKAIDQPIDYYIKSINYYQHSIVIGRKIGDRLIQAMSLDNLGSLSGNLGDYKIAIDYHQQSLDIFREIGHRNGEASSLDNLGNAYRNLGEYFKAIDYHQQSLAIDREIGDRKGEATSLNNLGLTFLKNNQLEPAQTHLFDAIKIWEDIRHLLRNKDDWKVSIFEIQARSYGLLQQVLVAQGQPKQALEISERGRNRALIELLAAQLSETPQQNKAPPTLKDIQEIAQQQQATLVEYSIVDDQIYSWVIAPTGKITFRSHTLPQDTTLAELVKFSREQIGVRGRGNQNPASPANPKDSNPLQELYQLLITPIVDLLPEKESERIIFIPHQELFMVPFAALLDDNHKYLIENHTILTAPSIQSLSFTRQHWHRVKDSNGTPLIVGNPTMPKINVGLEQEPLDPLPYAETEALTIAQLLNTTALIGPLATESTIVDKMANASLIHLATHGLVDGIYYRGAIALAPDKPDHDGFLTSREILSRYAGPEKSLLKAKLVVLSACDTGRGEIKGEGVVGLSRSLIAAGVPSLVVSLWQVPDDDTAKLMREFYTNIYTHKFDKAKAMREAMLSMLNDGDGNPDPSAWAAFTVIGEAR